MTENIKEILEKILLYRLNKRIKIVNLQKVGSGYHSNGYKINLEDGESLFLKKIKSNDMGFEFPERKICSLLTSHSMSNRARSSKNPQSHGIIVKGEKISILPEINEETEIYQIQEYGGEGKSYLEILEGKEKKETIDEEDKREIGSIVEYLSEIHLIKHPSKETKRLNSVYNDFLRNVIGHPEYLLMLLHEIPENNVALSPKKQKEFLGLMLETMHELKDNSKRLNAIHGDFWGTNVIFKKDNSIYVVDHSRMPWGDSGFDVGFWLSQYLIKYITTKKDYYKELGEYFLEKYLEKTRKENNQEMQLSIVYSLGLVSTMYISPKIVPDLTEEIRKEIYEHAKLLLKQKKFIWP